MMEFCKTEICTSLRHCRACRDASPAGIQWRAMLLHHYAGPDAENVNFDCPQGIHWSGPAPEYMDIADVPAPPAASAQIRAARAGGCRSCQGL